MARLTADKPFLHPDCEITDATFGRYIEIGRGSRVAHSHLDDYSYCDRYADIANASVGKFSNIAAFVRIGATDHPMEKASQHHFHYRSGDYFDDATHDADWFAFRQTRRAVIGHDTWLGNGAQVRPEVTIGHGAVVAGGAIVTKDVPPYMIVAGIPAVPLRARFTQSVADRMMALAWWDWPHDALRTALDDFRAMQAEAFLEKYE
ncbi:chloramphenicol acetyltransferase [Sulfitobacter donghicola]|uniref:Chloramphenicol acetyltransferase n=1 Tax=Sulfitobacter donghicola DSW-25 = KCTC 12864 = JCM 14565 TaxID=1300350 RepID=A0A073IC27_9RHOB|nr:chloramphenicol acetyltransferase [Sulfitobacter donghicola]KEJ87888.1 chloramphenicol acetyltransferase [Sulfitobacter donghicola DSW-25 = KCTC 12864 = JCM 14565]KIN67265.1 Phosphonate metabolim protein, transferase hexapeptide repeat family [Sulfitobacter donghicola DSW-25 = KCTC 12864 = JCM 14565]